MVLEGIPIGVVTFTIWSIDELFSIDTNNVSNRWCNNERRSTNVVTILLSRWKQGSEQIMIIPLGGVFWDIVDFSISPLGGVFWGVKRVHGYHCMKITILKSCHESAKGTRKHPKKVKLSNCWNVSQTRHYVLNIKVKALPPYIFARNNRPILYNKLSFERLVILLVETFEESQINQQLKHVTNKTLCPTDKGDGITSLYISMKQPTNFV